jgi:hypothetical protein
MACGLMQWVRAHTFGGGWPQSSACHEGQSFSLACMKAVLISFFLEQKGTSLISPLQAALSSWLANMIKCYLSLTPVTFKQWNRLTGQRFPNQMEPNVLCQTYSNRLTEELMRSLLGFPGLIPIWGEIIEIDYPLVSSQEPDRVLCRLRWRPWGGPKRTTAQNGTAKDAVGERGFLTFHLSGFFLFL